VFVADHESSIRAEQLHKALLAMRDITRLRRLPTWHCRHKAPHAPFAAG
jgi:hypothetical protein